MAEEDPNGAYIKKRRRRHPATLKRPPESASRRQRQPNEVRRHCRPLVGDPRCFRGTLRIPARVLCRGLCEPGLEARLTESRVIAGKERAFAYLDAVVARVRVRDYVAWILARSQVSTDEFIETKLFRPSDFNGAIHR